MARRLFFAASATTPSGRFSRPLEGRAALLWRIDMANADNHHAALAPPSTLPSLPCKLAALAVPAARARAEALVPRARGRGRFQVVAARVKPVAPVLRKPAARALDVPHEHAARDKAR